MIVFTSFPILSHWLRWTLLCRHDAVKVISVISLFWEKNFFHFLLVVHDLPPLDSTFSSFPLWTSLTLIPPPCNTITTDDDDVVTQSMPETLWNAETNIISMISILRSSSQTFAFYYYCIFSPRPLLLPNRRPEWIDFRCYDFSTEYKCCQASITSHWSRNDSKSL